MKNVKIILILMVLSALTAMPAMAAVSESFDSCPTSTAYGTIDYMGFHAENAWCGMQTGTTGTPLPLPLTTNAIRLRDAASPATLLEYRSLDGNGKDGGVGVISFNYRAWDSSPVAIYDVSVSINGGAYTIIGAQINTTSPIYALWSYTLNNASDNIKIKVTRVSGERLHIDDFNITDFGGATYESDAHVLAGGGGGGAIISSLVDTPAEKQIVHTCQIIDDGLGTYNTNTIINGITFTPGGAFTPTAPYTLMSYVAGAELFDGTNTYSGTVSSSGITFSGAPLMTLLDGGAAVNLQLAIWLKTSLPFDADHEVLEFVLGPTNFSVDPAASHFAADTPVTSGPANNEIEIIATGIGITTQPPASVAVNSFFLVRAGFVDVNNSIDEDWPAENITLSVNTGIGNLSSVSGLTILSISGQSLFSSLLYDVLDTGIKLQATSTSFPGPAISDAFNTCSITIDSYPLCWDGSAAVDAQPFALHITIRNWTEAYGQDMRLKLFDNAGSPDCYQYTVANGWSATLTSYFAKPAVAVDANGNWSGWVAIKSNGRSSIKARVRHATNTTPVLTSAFISGTALNLASQGGIVYDDNSRATDGNIILARGPSNEILGSYIAEDNGLPQDQTYATVGAGGWCMAMCEGYCDEEIMFESWNPATWPENGAPEFTDVATICVEGGAIVKIDVILPVELLTFTATSSDASVTLNWATASETNSNRFDIFRNNELVHQVVAANNPSGSTYAWTDNNVTNGTLYTYSLNVVDLAGNSEEIATTEASPSFNDATVTEYALHQNFPNPFNPETAIAFDLVDGGFVTLSIYNVLGQQVASLVNGTMNAGRHVVNFSATDLPSGLYLYRIEANGFTAQKKMIVMK